MGSWQGRPSQDLASAGSRTGAHLIEGGHAAQGKDLLHAPSCQYSLQALRKAARIKDMHISQEIAMSPHMTTISMLLCMQEISQAVFIQLDCG